MGIHLNVGGNITAGRDVNISMLDLDPGLSSADQKRLLDIEFLLKEASKEKNVDYINELLTAAKKVSLKVGEAFVKKYLMG